MSNKEDEVWGFRYYLVGSTPVAVMLDTKMRKMGTMVPDKKTHQLKLDMKYLKYIREGKGVSSLDKDAFDEACKKIYFANNDE